MPDQNTPGSLPTGAVPPPQASQPVENEKIEPCPWCDGACTPYMGSLAFVACDLCEAQGAPRYTEAEAIAEWNRVSRAVREAPAREKLIAELTRDVEAEKQCLHNAVAELNRARQQAGPVAQALDAYRVARAKLMRESGIAAQTAMVNAHIALRVALDAEATSTTLVADASAIRGVPAGEKREVVDQAQADTGSLTFTAGGEVMYPATQFYAMRERAEKAETKWRELYDRAEQAEERNAELGGSRVYTTTEYEKLRRRFHATRAQLRTAVVTIKTMERGSSRARDRVEAFWMAARDRAEKAEATLAERNKRIATLEAAAQAVIEEFFNGADPEAPDPVVALRAALEGTTKENT